MEEASHNKGHKLRERMRAMTLVHHRHPINHQVAVVVTLVFGILGNNVHSLRIMSQHLQAAVRPHLLPQQVQNAYQSQQLKPSNLNNLI